MSVMALTHAYGCRRLSFCAEQIVALQASRDAANCKCERLSGKVQTLRDALEGTFENSRGQCTVAKDW